MTINTEQVVTKVGLDAEDFFRGVHSINEHLEDLTSKTKKAADKSSKAMGRWIQGFTDLKNAIMTGTRVIGGLGAALGKLAKDGAKFNQMMVHQTIALGEASKKTKGLIDQMTLLQMANTASAFGVAKTEKEFAKFAETGTILAQKLGIDAPDAIQRLIRGIGKMEVELLDELGIRVRLNDALAQYSQETGIAVGKMTTAQRQLALQNYVMGKADELVKGHTLDVQSSGQAYNILKNRVKDFKTEMGKQVDDSSVWKMVIQGVTSRVNDLSFAVRNSSFSISEWGEGLNVLLSGLGTLSGFTGKQVGQGFGALSGIPLDMLADQPWKYYEKLKTIQRVQKAAGINASNLTQQATGYLQEQLDSDLRAAQARAQKYMDSALFRWRHRKRGGRKKSAGQKRWEANEKEIAKIDKWLSSNEARKQQLKEAEPRYWAEIERKVSNARSGAYRRGLQRSAAGDRKTAKGLRQQLAGRRESISSMSGELKEYGWGALENMMDEESWNNIMGGMDRMRDKLSSLAESMGMIREVGQAAFGGIAAGVGALTSGITGATEAFSDAVVQWISGEKSWSEAWKDSFRSFLQTWSKQMMMRSLESAATSLLMLALGNYPGAAKAAGAAAAFAAAAAIGGMGARAIGPKPDKQRKKSAGVDRGMGKGGGTIGAASNTFVYNINTITPPDPDEAALFIAGTLAHAKNMGVGI